MVWEESDCELTEVVVASLSVSFFSLSVLVDEPLLTRRASSAVIPRADKGQEAKLDGSHN